METTTDPRARALFEAMSSSFPRPLIEWLLGNFEALERIDFGESEPLGITAPTPIGPRR